MRIVLAADGSKFTKKALAFLATHESLAGPDDEVVVVNVQPPMPPRVRTMVGAAAVNGYHEEEAAKVLAPIEKFLQRKGISASCEWKAGEPASQIVAAAQKAKAHLIVMGTHGYGMLGRAVMGSVATRVLAESPIPVLLVK
ncbi:MAG TPA: universal stress protein [Ramlibacter sp.]|jgi:nucleotide-binding universal stress UspA family protein|uniref:universal stress protein n=1 Tax=Ramlibacter sp. TaxID=1917967 RepID=UPI002D661373|nr:universal stress protein [Ramlibacter sp.]HZY20233.1 universal stress protein [Ramlibacter sp.]